MSPMHPKPPSPRKISIKVAAAMDLDPTTIDKVMKGGTVKSPRDQKAIIAALAAEGFTVPMPAASAAPSDGSPQ